MQLEILEALEHILKLDASTPLYNQDSMAYHFELVDGVTAIDNIINSTNTQIYKKAS